MRIINPNTSLFGVLSVCLAIAGCDEKDDMTTGNDSNADEGKDDDDGEESEGGETTGAGTMDPGTAGSGGTGGTGEVTVPPECQPLCDCIGGLGGDPLSCGIACGGAIADAEPDDRGQCLMYLELNAYGDCNPECESFATGG